MNPAVFIDANVPIYAAGREHPYKQPCARILRILADDPQSFVTDSEVLQEIMHRYLASGRWTLGREVVRAFAEAMRGRIEPVHGKTLPRRRSWRTIIKGSAPGTWFTRRLCNAC